MNIGMVGAGRMGANMVRRLIKGGHSCVVFDRNPASLEALAKEGAATATSLSAMVALLKAPRVIWLMVPSGAPTEEAVTELQGLLASGAVVVDGGNSYFKDSIRRAHTLKARGIQYLDCGTSGGVWGEARGYCLMVGGEKEAFDVAEPVFKTLAPGQGSVPPSEGREGRHSSAEQGYLYCGPSGAGHFVKMLHNGIEYGIMQAYAEGFELLRGRASEVVEASSRYELPLADIAELWRRGSVVSSWLLDLTAMALAEDEKLVRFKGHVPDSGEGRWSLEAAIDEALPAPVLSAALFERFRSRQTESYGDKLLSAMREKFGGHRETGA